MHLWALTLLYVQEAAFSVAKKAVDVLEQRKEELVFQLTLRATDRQLRLPVRRVVALALCTRSHTTPLPPEYEALQHGKT